MKKFFIHMLKFGGLYIFVVSLLIATINKAIQNIRPSDFAFTTEEMIIGAFLAWIMIGFICILSGSDSREYTTYNEEPQTHNDANRNTDNPLYHSFNRSSHN